MLSSVVLASLLTHRGPLSATYAPADQAASKQVRAMLNYLKEQQGRTLVSGQTDYKDAVWIKENTGKHPAMLGLDFMHSPKRMGKQTGNIDQAIDWFKNKHGFVTFQWHWSSPTGASDPNSGFYSKNNTFDLAKAMDNPKSLDYLGLITDIDDVAEQLKQLDKAGVPIIFRPLHEAQGGWFWWGSKGPEACMKLYKLIFDRMTQHHNLHNLAWAWTAYPMSQKKGDPAKWYPGDNMVDFVVSDYCEKKAEYDDLVRLTEGRKMVALAETMNAPDPDKVLSQTPWAYWVTWARRDWNKRSTDDMKVAMKSPKTVTLDKMPDLTKR